MREKRGIHSVTPSTKRLGRFIDILRVKFLLHSFQHLMRIWSEGERTAWLSAQSDVSHVVMVNTSKVLGRYNYSKYGILVVSFVL